MFNSVFRKVWNHSKLEFPKFTGERVMMMPVLMGSLAGVPEQYRELVYKMYDSIEVLFLGEVGYLTIDEKDLKAGDTLRRRGLHVDGYYHGRWGDGWGMLTVSSTAHCRAYLGMFEGDPKDEGECDHLSLPNAGTLFDARYVYWVDGACVHESVPIKEDTRIQFVRLSMSNSGPWFEGYTENPTGIKPSGEAT